MMDGNPGILPLYPNGGTDIINGKTSPQSLARGSRLVMAPEDDERRISLESNVELSLYDGRNKAQNGWYVVQSLIPAGKTGKVC